MVRLVHARVCVLETRSPVCVLNCMHSLDVARGRGGEGAQDLSPSLLLLSSFFVNPFLPPRHFFSPSLASSSLLPLAYFLASTTGASTFSLSLSLSIASSASGVRVNLFLATRNDSLVTRCVRVSSTLRLDGEEEGADVEDKTRDKSAVEARKG